MTTAPVKTRFAPSPTGLIHLGNVRTALFSALYAQHRHGVFLIRIEDTDHSRSETAYTHALQEDLNWLGLHWQEGPVVGGPHGPYLQSERSAVYDEFFAALEQRGQAYPCFCSERELEISRKIQLSAGRPPRYQGTCAHLSPAEIERKRAQGLAATLRFRVKNGQHVQFDDLVRGPQNFATDEIGDFIIRRNNGTPAFFFCNAVDDALMGVSHVLRGEDHLTNTPRQILILEALGLRIPLYGHIAMIVGDDGAPLSKRHGSRNIRELRSSGYFPGAIINYLARLGHHYENHAYMDVPALAADFELDKLGRAPARFDAGQLQHWQHEAISRATVEELWSWMGEGVHAVVPPAKRTAFVEAVRHNLTLPEHAMHWARVLFTDSLEWNAEALETIKAAGCGFFEAATQALHMHQGHFKAMAEAVKLATGAKGKALFLPLRAALTGQVDGPEMAGLLPLIDFEQAVKRLAVVDRINLESVSK